MTKIEMTVGLDEESKKLLNAAIKAAATIAGAAAGGKATKTTKTTKAKDEEADEDFDDMGDADDGDADDGDADDGDEGDADDGDADDGDTDEVTVDTVGEALKAYATAPGGSKALAVKLLKAKGGTEKLSVLKKAKFAAVIEAAKAATVALKKKAKAK